MFIRIFGARQTMDSAMDTAPAASRKKSMNAKHPMSFLETIVIDELWGGGLFQLPRQ